MQKINQLVVTYPFLVMVVSFLVGYLFMPLVVRLARKYHFVVSPNKRTSHSGEIPNVGGINIFISFTFTLLLFAYNIFPPLQYAVVGVFIILLVGFLDDLVDMPVRWKLIGEIIAGIFVVVLANLRIESLQGVLGIYELPLLVSYLFSIFVFVVVVNAINLIDGVDGLASGLGLVYALFFSIYFQYSHETVLSISAYTLVGSLAVFFVFNVFSDKHKIFMGDSGSLLLGYLFTLYIFIFCERQAHLQVPTILQMSAAPSVAITVLFIPLFDTLRVMSTRIYHKISPFKADRNHVHHLLLRLGFTHKQVSLLLIAIQIIFIIIGLGFRNISGLWLAIIFLVIGVSLSVWLRRAVEQKESATEE